VMRHLRLVGTTPRGILRRLTVQAVEHHETKGVLDGLDFDPFAKIPSGARVEEVSRGKSWEFS